MANGIVVIEIAYVCIWRHIKSVHIYNVGFLLLLLLFLGLSDIESNIYRSMRVLHNVIFYHTETKAAAATTIIQPNGFWNSILDDEENQRERENILTHIKHT